MDGYIIYVDVVSTLIGGGCFVTVAFASSKEYQAPIRKCTLNPTLLTPVIMACLSACIHLYGLGEMKTFKMFYGVEKSDYLHIIIFCRSTTGHAKSIRNRSTVHANSALSAAVPLVG